MWKLLSRKQCYYVNEWSVSTEGIILQFPPNDQYPHDLYESSGHLITWEQWGSAVSIDLLMGLPNIKQLGMRWDKFSQYLKDIIQIDCLPDGVYLWDQHGEHTCYPLISQERGEFYTVEFYKKEE